MSPIFQLIKQIDTLVQIETTAIENEMSGLHLIGFFTDR